MMNQKKKNSPTTADDNTKAEALFPLKGYIILNLIFWAFCIIQMLALRWIFKDSICIYFFFTVLGAGFTIASFFDYFYDRIAARISHPSDKKEKNS